ncbi:BON domain-containing protein [Caballeronia sp. GAFFF1]|uniref:BON domain-containing protein n=1 Tax=Caballeronia sp. GAFFF1 TaxID=2921779 RepID=UPI0020296572|nr:BON domain-containing protein [Caballeronia sp. GAFFF1]
MQTASAENSTSVSSEGNSKAAARAENRALGHAVRRSLTKVKGLDSSRINVLAHGSTVTLAGSAPDQSQITSAAAAAAKVSGVSRVDNRLAINEPGH